MTTALTGCNASTSTTHPLPSQGNASTKIQAVGAENQYGNLIQQIGGQYVTVNSIIDNPNTDPHTYEVSPQTATQVASAQLIVQNGLGYDNFMRKLEASSPNSARQVVDVQTLLGLPDNTPNPHLWYHPDNMVKVARAISQSLSTLDNKHAAYYHRNLATFVASIHTLDQTMAAVSRQFPHAPVAVTEPVADYLLQDCGMNIKTPWTFQSAVMDGTDASPQDVTRQASLFTSHSVKVFFYNQQVVDSLTTSLLTLAKQNHIPVVGVYETMPADHTYQTWMQDEIHAIQNALQNNASTETMIS